MGKLTDDEVFARLALYWRTRLTQAELARILQKSPRQCSSLMQEWFGGRGGDRTELPPAFQGLLVGKTGHVLPLDGIGSGAALFKDGLNKVPTTSDMLVIADALRRVHVLSGKKDIEEASLAPFGLPVEDVMIVDNLNEQRALHFLCASGARKEALEFVYVSKKDKLRLRFSPTRILRLSDRVRVRGYAESLDGKPLYVNGLTKPLNDYVDIVPSRIVWPPALAGVGLQKSPKGDVEWGKLGAVVALFALDLTAKERAALQEEYIDVLNEDGDGVCIEQVRYPVFFYKKRIKENKIIGSNKKAFQRGSVAFQSY